MLSPEDTLRVPLSLKGMTTTWSLWVPHADREAGKERKNYTSSGDGH